MICSVRTTPDRWSVVVHGSSPVQRVVNQPRYAQRRARSANHCISRAMPSASSACCSSWAAHSRHTFPLRSAARPHGVRPPAGTANVVLRGLEQAESCQVDGHVEMDPPLADRGCVAQRLRKIFEELSPHRHWLNAPKSGADSDPRQRTPAAVSPAAVPSGPSASKSTHTAEDTWTLPTLIP